MEQLVELSLPNILGAEKEAIEKAVTVAEKMGFSKDRIEDLKTALAEACINAIEHGNKFDQNKRVRVTFSANNNSLQVIVHDEGDGIDPKNPQKKGARKRFSLSAWLWSFPYQQPGERVLF